MSIRSFVLPLAGAVLLAMSVSANHASAQTVPIVVFNPSDWAECNDSMIGATEYIIIGEWPDALRIKYVCNGFYWEYDPTP